MKGEDRPQSLSQAEVRPLSTSETKVSHPGFARFWVRVSNAAEKRGASDHRRRLLSGLSGSVVEVGAGNGLNFGYYPEAVAEVVAVEPEPYLRERAEEAAAVAPVPVTVVDGTAERLPLDDASCDAVVASLMLCSVREQDVALKEMRRVLRAGGELRFYEHVRSPNRLLGALEDLIVPVWSRLGGGCHPNRRTTEAVAQAGFTIADLDEFPFAPAAGQPRVRHVLGRAVRT